MDAEISYKKGKHVAALAPLKRAVFRKSLREEVALNLVETLATSVLLTNASAWWPLTAAQTKVINGPGVALEALLSQWLTAHT